MNKDIFIESFHLSNKLKNVSKVNIKFFIGSDPDPLTININPSQFMIKSWFNRNAISADRVNWLESIFCNIKLTFDKIDLIIEKEKPNIICFGLYMWNFNLYQKIGRYIKTKYPNIILVAGGPEIYAHKDSIFWNDYTWIDVAVYGDGEEAFVSIIDAIACGEVKNDVYNICTKSFCAEFKRFKNNDFELISPYLDNIDDIINAKNQILNLVPDAEVEINWEFTRGCPYRCSFCDWSSGLHTKISRKKYDWKVDLFKLASIGIAVSWIDANIGMFKDDIDVVKYAYSLKKKFQNFNFNYNNFAKLHKKAMYDIIDFVETEEPGKANYNIALQDINETVLKNIDRPDISWHEQKEFITKTKTKHKSFQFSPQIIIGLPGQTFETMGYELTEFYNIDTKSIMASFWSLLPNSPAFSKEYQEKFKIKSKDAWHVKNIDKIYKNRHELAEDITSCRVTKSNIVIETYSNDLSSIIAFYGMVVLYNKLVQTTGKINKTTLEKIISNIDYWNTFGTSVTKQLDQDLKNYNQLFLAIEHNQQILTFEQFFSIKQNQINAILGKI